MPINKIAIAGAGIMGSSMGQIFATKGYTVAIYDLFPKALESAKAHIEQGLDSMIAKSELTAGDKAAALRRISFTADLEGFRDCDLLVECIVENMEIKHQFYSRVSAIVPETSIIASNTSGLSITGIASAVKHPERFAGMHWFNPPHIIPLIEIIKGEKTAQATADELYRISLAIGKKPVMVNKDAPGFIANRIQLAVLRECLHILDSGIGSAEDIDKCMKYALGFRYACMGPFEVCDLGGIDTFHHVASYLWRDLSAAKEPYGLVQKLVDEKHFGVKTGQGFYDYSGDKAAKAIARRDRLFLTLKAVDLE